jgi:rubrerythrin
MKSLKGTKTEKNLMEAFAGESQATNKYRFYSAQAKKEGYEQIAEVFAETSDNEKEHAKLWFKYLHGGDVPTTHENLLDAAAGEKSEWTAMYKRMAEEAKEEGFDEIAYKFEQVGIIEKRHEERYRKLAELVKKNKVYKKSEKTMWICRNCGHIFVGKEAPKICPVCNHEQSFFQVYVEQF